jgi:ABC-type amino acid transport substrate-binding protein
LVFPTGAGLDDVQNAEDFLKLDAGFLRRLRIGVYDRSPASAWLSQHGLLDSGVPYKMLSADPDQYPGSIIEQDLAQRQIDVAVVWGPMAAYFAKRVKSPALRVVPVRSEPGLTMEFDMAMGIRHGEPSWKAQIESVIQSHQAQIHAVLKSFDVPVLEVPHAATKQP